jgi:hypothetical protein
MHVRTLQCGHLLYLDKYLNYTQSQFSSLQNAVYFIMLLCLVSVLLTFWPLETVRPIYRTGTPLPSKHPILYIFSTNIRTKFFKHAAHSPFFLFKIPFIS